MSRVKDLAQSLGANMTASATVRKSRVDTAHAPAGVDPKFVGISKSKNTADIEVARIVRDDGQPRQEFDDQEIRRLAESLKRRGQLQPIRVRWDSSKQNYMLIAGERRWRAAQLAGLPTITAVIQEGEISETEIRSLQLIENLLREDLKPMEQARAFRSLMDAEGWSNHQAADELGIPRSTVIRALKLLELPEQIQAGVEDGSLTPTAAYEIAQIPDPAQQVATAKEVVDKGLSRNETRTLVASRKSGRGGRPAPPRKTEFRSGQFVFTVQGPVDDEDALWDAWRDVLDRQGRSDAA